MFRDLPRSAARSGLPLLLVLLAAVSMARAETTPTLPHADRIRIAEGFRLADAIGDRLWPGWKRAPFAVLLVTPEHEFLIRHPNPSDDFVPLGEDTLLGSPVWFRPRVNPPNLLATFPAVNGISTVVIGQPANTQSKHSTRWVLTLLHEHFHQFQESEPGYYADVNALGLAGKDASGMWMLNYPFPYARAEVKERFSAMARALLDALQAQEESEFYERLSAYRRSKERFQSLLEADDRRYFEFQLWKEGVARYTECHLAERAASDFEPGPEFRGLEDYRPFADVARELRSAIERELESVQLDKARRTVVYNFGAAEGLVLDRARPDWRARYVAERFSLEGHFRSGAAAR